MTTKLDDEHAADELGFALGDALGDAVRAWAEVPEAVRDEALADVAEDVDTYDALASHMLTPDVDKPEAHRMYAARASALLALAALGRAASREDASLTARHAPGAAR